MSKQIEPPTEMVETMVMVQRLADQEWTAKTVIQNKTTQYHFYGAGKTMAEALSTARQPYVFQEKSNGKR